MLLDHVTALRAGRLGFVSHAGRLVLLESCSPLETYLFLYPFQHGLGKALKGWLYFSELASGAG